MARVLVVDDVADAAEAMAELLELDGYEVRTARDGLHALQVTAEFRPHCVLLDIGMPRMDGFELAKLMRERFGDDIVLIAITGRAEENSRVSQTFDRVDHYFLKPVDPDELRKVLPLQRNRQPRPAAE
jgi:DNA-binding response OmpR family regulator